MVTLGSRGAPHAGFTLHTLSVLPSAHLGDRNPTYQGKSQHRTGKDVSERRLAGSAGGACDSGPRGHEFKSPVPTLGREPALKKKKRCLRKYSKPGQLNASYTLNSGNCDQHRRYLPKTFPVGAQLAFLKGEFALVFRTQNYPNTDSTFTRTPWVSKAFSWT